MGCTRIWVALALAGSLDARRLEPRRLEPRRLERPRDAHAVPQLPGARRLLYHLLHTFSVGEVMHPRVAVFMVGLPGAGKSRVINLRYASDHRKGLMRVNSTVVVDLDREIVKHPEFDPADPDKLYLAADRSAYKWADERVEARFLSGLADPKVRRLVIDGTGTNIERQIRRMNQARKSGFFVKALYVRVPARTAVVRAAMRKRGVCPERIHEYQGKLARAMQAAKQYADEVETFDVTFDDAPLPGTMHGYVDPITSIVF
jgi:shikimate kinase